MIPIVLKHYIFLLLIFFSFSAFGKKTKLCSTVIIHGDKLRFDKTEKQLVCGDKKSKAYKVIPDYEASFIMTGFLQSRGYLEPRYETINDVLHVHTGHESVIKSFKLVSENKKLKREVKRELNRLFRKKLLSTDILNSVEAEALALIRQRGYPCAKVKTQVDISKKQVQVELDEYNYFNFGEVTKEKIPGLRDNALDRYYAFKENEMFNADLLSLTEKRMIRDGVVPGTYFVENCQEENTKFSLSQNFISGPPRTIRFGAGVSTEQGPMARIKWKNSRYNSMASQLSANLQASLRSQSISVTADSFIWHHEPRRSILSTAELARESQVDYEQVTYTLDSRVKWSRDSEGYSKIYTLGPTYEGGTYVTDGNADTKSFASGTVKGSSVWMAHNYELFDFHPQEGKLYGLYFDFRDPALGFSDQLLKLDSTLLRLDRLTNWGRGTLIGGLRLNAGTTWITNTATLNGLPPAVKFYGGGSDDVRGYTLKSLPENSGLGALTKFSAKLELRRTYLYFKSVEGFTFLDMAKFGDKSWNLDNEMYYSPGVGLRWRSPIGMVQTFIARAYRTAPYKDQGNLFFVGIGGLF
jgi:translocation and assembly module TamA